MNRLLVFSPGTIQEQLMLFPSLDALSSSQIDIVVPPAAKDVYHLSPQVKQVMAFDLDSSKGLADWSNLYGMAREQEYDAAFTISSSLTVRFLLWLLGIKTRVGVTGGTGEFLLTHAIPAQEHRPKTQTYSDLFKVMQMDRVGQLSLSVAAEAVDWSRAALRRLGIADNAKPLLLYDELDAHPNTTYDLENWSSVIRGIRDRHPDLPIVLLESPNNQNWIAQMQEQMLGITVLTTQNLEQTTAVISQAQALIASNSAPLYLGVGTKCPVVGLFGPHKPELYLPEGTIGLRASSGNIQDIAPIQVIESMSQLCFETQG